MATAKEIAADINSQLGSEVVRLGSDPMFTVTRLATGVLPLDHLLDGGLPYGRITEVFGDYSTLKSYWGYKALAAAQATGGIPMLIDTEHSWDPEWAAQLGVSTHEDDIVISRPENGEAAIDAIETVLRRHDCPFIMWDSIAATLPKAEYLKSASDTVQPARQAEMMSRGLRKINTANSKTAILCVNQTRLNVGQMFGNPETTPGGKALPFYASYRLALRKGERIRDKKTKQLLAIRINATVEKFKLSTAASKQASFLFDLETGTVDDGDFLLAIGQENGTVIRTSNVMWKLAWGQPVKGKDAFRESLTTDDRRWILDPNSRGVKRVGKKKAVKVRKRLPSA